MTIAPPGARSGLLVHDGHLIGGARVPAGAGVTGGPFGGHEVSGFGRTTGADAVLEHPQVKTVSLRG
jgi:acyl-CoA reductase-like NAD-dependent aldehyde dehydrogenase